MNKRETIIIYIKLLLMAFFWGGTFIAGKYLSDVSSFDSAFMRFLISSILLLLIVWKLEGRIPLPQKKQIIPIFLLGLSGIFLYNVCFFTGLKYIEAGRASVIVANNPVLIALLSAYFFKEKLTPFKLLGIIISITGAVIVITGGDILSLFKGGIGVGEFYIFGCVISWVIYSLIGKSLMKTLSPLLSVTYSVLAGTILLFIPFIFMNPINSLQSFTIMNWGSFIYLALFGTVLGFLYYYQGIEKIGAIKAGLFINFVPVSSIILSFFILGEKISSSLFFGLIFVSCGVILTNSKFAEKSCWKRFKFIKNIN